MKLLLDESVPVQLRRHFTGHDARTVRYMGWMGRINGELLELARDEFDVLITVDTKMQYQQNITPQDVSVVVINARSNKMEDLEPLVPRVLDILNKLKRGEVRRIEG